MPFGLMVAMSCLWHTDFLAFYDGNTLCGFVYTATMKKLTFLMFFAVPQQLQSMGYGSRILSQLQAMCGSRKLIVSIEPCVDAANNIAQRLRRKRFYCKNGYGETGYFMKLFGQEKQELLVKNGVFDKGEFVRFFMLYSNCTVVPKVWNKI